MLCLVLLSGCSQSSKPIEPTPSANTLNKYSGMDYNTGFDTFLSLITYTTSQSEFDQHMSTAVSLFKRYNDFFDIYNTYEGINNLKTINDNAGKKAVQVDPEIIECLLKAKEFYELSNHEFDITIGAVLQVWHNYRDEGLKLNESGKYGKLPSMEELETAKACTGWEYVEIDDENNTVFINNPCVSLDVGGIAKGFAAEKIAQVIEPEITGGIVNAGGNSRTIGSKPEGSAWVSGISNPANPGASLLAIGVKGSQSIVTSGDYQRYYVAEDGKQYHHIIDPDTLLPAMRYRSVTIITPNSGDADALSTTLYTLSVEEGKQVLAKYNESHPNQVASAIWIFDKDNAIEDENGFYAQNFYVTSTDELKGLIQILD